MGYYDIEDYKSYSKKQADIDNEIRRLKDKIKKIKSDNSKEQRKVRNHLMILLGAEILRCTDFDFEKEDFNLQEWRAYCNTYAKRISDLCIITKPSEEEKPKEEKPADQSQEESQESAPEPVQEPPAPEEQYQANINNYTSEDKDFY